ncbi:MAG: zf-HC2 domain-containing protein [Gemmatimonadetes bacterium]|nr:zf-HC2 domain-containing protein [Gemmatimonadota bacterium]
MVDLDREVAGIRCREVLELLSSYLDGDVTESEKRRIDAHLLECDHCLRFGRDFAEAIGALRRELRRSPALDQDVARRLRERLAKE